jgi:hypothetical protein
MVGGHSLGKERHRAIRRIYADRFTINGLLKSVPEPATQLIEPYGDYQGRSWPVRR